MGKGFTLVELIVVITILAILGTIAFISLQGYTKTARNSVRLDAVSKLATSLDSYKVQWKNLMAFAFTGSEVPSAQIGWTGAIVGTDYIAWSLNAQSLQIKPEQFQDPLTGGNYLIWVTSKRGGLYEAAAMMEVGTSQKAKVMWVYVPRNAELVLGQWNVGESTYLLSNYGDIGKIVKGDFITSPSLPTGTQVTFVSNDGATMRFNNNFTTPGTQISLASNEVTGLIVGIGWNPVINDSETELPYGLWSSSSSWGWSSSSSSSSSGWGGACEFGTGEFGTCTFGS